MAGLPWYKHYTDAHQSDKLTKILSEFGLKGYGQYWILLEHMGKKFTGKERSFTFETRNLKSILHISHNKLFVNYMEFLTKIGLISYKIQGKSTIVKTPILFILQGKDNKYDKNKRGKCVGKTDPKIEDIRLKKEKEREREKQAHPAATFETQFDPDFIKFEKTILAHAADSPQFRRKLKQLWPKWKKIGVDKLYNLIDARMASPAFLEKDEQSQRVSVSGLVLGESDMLRSQL